MENLPGFEFLSLHDQHSEQIDHSVSTTDHHTIVHLPPNTNSRSNHSNSPANSRNKNQGQLLTGNSYY